MKCFIWFGSFPSKGSLLVTKKNRQQPKDHTSALGVNKLSAPFSNISGAE